MDWVLVTDQVPADPLGWRSECMDPAAGHVAVAGGEGTEVPALGVHRRARIHLPGREFPHHLPPRSPRKPPALAEPIAQFAHPWRDCIYAEAEASVSLPKYDGQPVTEQAACYRRLGHPEHWGLWASGLIARQHTPEVKAHGAAWTRETDMWTLQCQISEPFVLPQPRPAPRVPPPGDHFLTEPSGWPIRRSGRH